MGQSNSRIQNHTTQHAPSGNSTASSSVAGVSPELAPDSPVDVGAESSNRSQSRRSSVRKSILKLVTPSNIRSRINSVASSPGNVRRPWRHSRRWSKVQTDPISQPEGSDIETSFENISSDAGPSDLPHRSLDKGKQREITSEGDDEYHNAISTTYDEAPQFSETPSPPLDRLCITPTALTSTLPSVETIHEDAPSERSLNDESSPVSSEATSELPPQHQQPIFAHPQEQQSAPLPRQFPPPGTLVVVQGIVHTTDVSRPNNSTISGPSDSEGSPAPQSGSRPDIGADRPTHSTRNRLSALLRPRSSSRPVSTIINDAASSTANTLFEGDSLSMLGSEPPTSSDESVHTAVTTPNIDDLSEMSREPPLSAAEQTQPASENRSSAISSSSIDVLGTLLSVAAAATAASLLTGSSEPILSSGLAPPQAGLPPHIPHHIHNASMPNLPTFPGPGMSTTVLPDVSAAGRSERMRQAWGTIRERLGLRPSASPMDNSRSQHHQDNNTFDSVYDPPSGDGIGLTSATDTRELMLAEMARAFNIGLGLNGLGGLAPGINSPNERNNSEVGNTTTDDVSRVFEDSEGTSHQTASPTIDIPTTLPPEGSFERFLVDLQIDLRTALTQTTDDELDSEELPASSLESDESQPITSTEHIRQTPPSSTLLPWETLNTSRNIGDHHPSDAQQTNDSVSSDIPESLLYRDGEYADMPFLRDVTDSESEFDEDEHGDDDFEDDDFRSAEHDSVHNHSGAESPNAQPGYTPGTGRIDASGRINWWRLYRFPPVSSPLHDTPNLRQPFVPTTATSVSPLMQTNATQPPSPLPTFGTIPSPSPNAVPQLFQMPSQSVVPVIVVGLQSVNSEWQADLPHIRDEGVDFFGQPTSDMGVGVETDDDDALDGWGSQHHTGGGRGWDAPTGRGRARGWQSRAANAIRNLRPGRRNAESTTDSQLPVAVPGSRTFLIYVIGGYYPPDHSIVTGGPNILDSFEALLELADLLGQVKPPTVSKDEIEKSGLQIIKASELPQYEQLGKVSSNCLDRCLICLDDYEPEDPIRVMSCRHAFHQACVDEWLQKGRNNCPACRSTGVSTDSQPTAPMPNSVS